MNPDFFRKLPLRPVVFLSEEREGRVREGGAKVLALGYTLSVNPVAREAALEAIFAAPFPLNAVRIVVPEMAF
jgi:hypothetical protein